MIYSDAPDCKLQITVNASDHKRAAIICCVQQQLQKRWSGPGKGTGRWASGFGDHSLLGLSSRPLHCSRFTLLKFYPRCEPASSSVAFLWSLFEFEIFILNAVLPKGHHHILLQRGSIRLKHHCTMKVLSQKGM